MTIVLYWPRLVRSVWLRRFSLFALRGTLALLLLVGLGRVAGGASSDQPNLANLPQVQVINQQLQQVWQEYQLQPSELASDEAWCRRVYLDILGRIPRVSELNAFVSSKGRDKRLQLVHSILHDDKYTEEYARNWTTLWTNILIGRSGGTERRTLTNREGMQKYLRDSFARNKPYDRMVYELVSATGTSVPGTEDFNGAVNFLAMKVNDEGGTLATSATSRIFMGLQVQCTQCHNHPFNEWKQQKFWEFNSFFRQTRALRQFVQGTREVASIRLINQDYGGQGGGNPEEAEVFYEMRNAELKTAYPVFIDGTEIGRSGFVEDVVRREQLAKLIVGSEYMDRMIANRIWAHFMGYGFTKPIDDLGPHNIASHPALLDYLGQQFRESGYDLKELMQWITASQPYSLSSKIKQSNQTDDPALGVSPKFSRFYLRQMRAEELYESLLVATQAEQTRGDYQQQERSKSDWLRQFVQAFGTDEGDETTTFNGTIPQVLMMFNGDLVKRATGTERGSMLWKVATSEMSSREKINHLFLAGLARRPTRVEIGKANELLRARNAEYRGDRYRAMAAALQDIWWAVLNSNEFIFNH